MIKIFNYSDEDFPSLESAIRQKKIPAKTSSSCNQHSTASVSNESVRENDNPKSGPKKSGTQKSPSAAKSDRKAWKKVLRPNEHKEAFTITVEDILMAVPETVPRKCRPRSMKLTKGRSFSGNPLDADNPVRQKGKCTLQKKPKRLSRIKNTVLNVRQSVKKAKELAPKVSLDGDKVAFDPIIPTECLWLTMYHGKLDEVKKILMNLDVNVSKERARCPNPNKHSKTSEISPSCDSQNEKVTQNEVAEKTESANDSGIKEVMFRSVLEGSPIPPHKLLIHHHNFKRYCNNCLTRELNEAAEALVSQIVGFQFNKYQKSPMKAVANKRYVLGLKQVKKFTKLNKVKLIIWVPDMEDSMCDLVDELKSLASAYCIPYIFAFTRRRLGFLSYKKVGVCCFGLLDYSGAEVNFARTIDAASVAKKIYEEKCSSMMKYSTLCLGDLVVSNEKTPDGYESIIEDFNKTLSFNTEDKTISSVELPI